MTIAALELSDRRWSTFVSSRPAVNAFHHAGWVTAVADCYRFRPLALTLIRDGAVVAGVPAIELGRGRRRRWVSLPFTDWCEPLLAEGVMEQEFAAALDDMRRSAGLARIELRSGIAATCGHPVPCGYVHELSLAADPDSIRPAFHQLRRRMLARAAKRGIVSRTSLERSDLCSVFFGLHVTTRRRLGVPVQPRRLFELIWERSIASGNGFVQIAYLEDTPIAAGIFLTSARRVTAKFLARDDTYAADGAMDALLWGAMRWGCENGRDVFDFGRTEVQHESLRRFKLSWGTTEKELNYTVFSAEPPSPSHERSNAALAALIRRSPEWVARALGHAAYRYAA